MADHGEPLDLEGARTALYGVPPRDFIAERSALAKHARASGDKDVAAAIQALRKPTVAAWLVNMLARKRPADLTELLELGRDMREGMGGVDGEGLRQLTRRRHQLVAALVTHARVLAAAAGQRVADDAARAVQSTLEATLADAESADLVAAGCLSEPLEVSGFGLAFGLGGAVARPAPDTEPRATVTDLGDRRARKEADIAEAEQALADAQTLAEQAERAYEEAQRHTAAQLNGVDKASARVDKLEAKLADARKAASAAEDAAKAARQAEADAEKGFRAATRSLAAATERMRRLRR
jgi:hypothetical protein